MLSDEEISNIYQVLSNPNRRRIIEVLGSRGKVGVKELIDVLNVSAGSLYYNMELLSDLVRRERDKSFTLTDKGWLAYRLLMDGKEKISEIKYYQRSPIPFRVRSRLSTIIFPSWFILAVFEDKLLRFIIPLSVLAFGFWSCYWSNVELTLFTISYKPLQWPIITAAKFVSAWIIIFLVADLIPFLFHGRIGGRGLLLLGLSISTIPLLPIPYIMTLISSNFAIQGLLIFLLQVSSCILLSTAISVSKNIGLERALLIGILIVYLNITLNIIFRI